MDVALLEKELFCFHAQLIRIIFSSLFVDSDREPQKKINRRLPILQKVGMKSEIDLFRNRGGGVIKNGAPGHFFIFFCDAPIFFFFFFFLFLPIAMAAA